MDGISCCKDCKNPMRKAVSGPPESQVKKSKVRHGSGVVRALPEFECNACSTNSYNIPFKQSIDGYFTRSQDRW